MECPIRVGDGVSGVCEGRGGVLWRSSKTVKQRISRMLGGLVNTSTSILCLLKGCGMMCLACVAGVGLKGAVQWR